MTHDPRQRLGPNFTLGELTVQNDKPGARIHLVTAANLAPLTRVAAALQVIRGLVRERHPGAVVHVTSGLRGGSGSSQHDTGHAADIRVDGVSPMFLFGLIAGHQARIGAACGGLRQVIAETTHDASALDGPMAPGSGRWVHVAVMGVTGEKWTAPTRSPWLRSWVDGTGRRVYHAP